MTGDFLNSLESLRHTIRSKKFGKALPADFYIARTWVEKLAPTFHSQVEHEIKRLAKLSNIQTPEMDWNVIKISKTKLVFSLLTYENPFQVGFPELLKSIIVNLESETLKKQSYLKGKNRFILHRKELLYPEESPQRQLWIDLTLKCEQAGLFEQPKKIGTKRYWQELLEAKGLAIEGQQLVNREETP